MKEICIEKLSEFYRVLGNNEINEHIANFKKFGYTILKEYLNPDKHNFIKNEIDRISNYHEKDPYDGAIKSLPKGEQKDSLSYDNTVPHLPIYNPIFIKLATRGFHHYILKYFINDNFYKIIDNKIPNYCLAHFVARKGKKPLNWHTDVRLQIPGDKTFSIQGFLPLNRMDSSTGSFCLIPSSNKTGKYPDENMISESDFKELELKAGDLLLFDSRIHHSTSVKSTEYFPWTLLYTYRCWWVKPGFDYWRYFTNNKSCLSNLESLDRVILGQSSEIPFDPRDSVSARKPIID